MSRVDPRGPAAPRASARCGDRGRRENGPSFTRAGGGSATTRRRGNRARSVVAPTRTTCRASSKRRSFGWILHRKLADPSRKTVPPSAASNTPARCVCAPVKAPRSWPKRTASARVGWNGGAVEDLERSEGTRALLVNRPRREPLPGPGRALEDGELRRRDPCKARRMPDADDFSSCERPEAVLLQLGLSAARVPGDANDRLPDPRSVGAVSTTIWILHPQECTVAMTPRDPTRTLRRAALPRDEIGDSGVFQHQVRALGPSHDHTGPVARAPRRVRRRA